MNCAVSLVSGAIFRWALLRLRGKDMTIIICHNKPQTGNEAGRPLE